MAFRTAWPMLIGALAAKFAAKRFVTEPGGEGDDWTWKHYLFGLLGAGIAGVGTSAIFKGRASAQHVFQGGLLLMGYKFFINEVAAKNEKMSEWFSGEEEVPEEALPEVSGQQMLPGSISWDERGKPYVLGADYTWKPIDESHRLPETAGMGQIVPIQPGMGQLAPVQPSMGADDEFTRAYAKQ
jgi:hypothetical protein